ncbi:hypothetical protein DSM3645_16875 [Blastopirellula marina DSM 3645]|uniref:Uncharacterized protein n=1 Tax=Blastopirellula marina DSM 3645 TaxID=314230 RepID=A3ZNF0_9BACT|nr:hypothetical protein DSM3645_16875 [Blastopirellula marina DSM 3645]
MSIYCGGLLGEGMKTRSQMVGKNEELSEAFHTFMLRYSVFMIR